MNEFTKEELELILKSIWWGGEDDETTQLQKLDDKIQSMIDNYCEHPVLTPESNTIVRCMGCSRLFNDIKVIK